MKMKMVANYQSIILAILIPSAACLLQWIFWSYLKPFAWFLFYPAVYLSSRINGRVGGSLSVILSASLAFVFFILPDSSFAAGSPNMFFSTAVFILLGLFVNYIQPSPKQLNYQTETLRGHRQGETKGSEQPQESARKAASELRQSRQQLKDFLDNSPFVFFQKDIDGKYELINIKFAQLFHQDVESIKGKTDHDIFPKEMADVFRANDLKVVESGKLITEEEIAPHEDGDHYYISYKFPVRNENDKIVSVAGIAVDITHHKQVEESIRIHLAELEVLYENSLNISRLLEPRDIAQHLIESGTQKLAWHHAVVRIYNPQTDRLETLAASQRGHTVSQEEIDRLNRLITRPGDGLTGWVIKHGEGVRSDNVLKDDRYVETYPEIRAGIYMPIQIRGQTLGSISIESERESAFSETDERLLTALAAQSAAAFENANLYQTVQKELDERLQAEEELRLSKETLQVYNDRLEHSNRDLQEFAYVASHDLQEPLRKVMAFSDRLVNKYSESLDETGRDYLNRMHDASQRMQTLLGDLLSYSRVSTRAQSFSPVDLNRVVQDVVSDLENRLERSKGKVESRDLPLIHADGSQIYQLLQNLVANALKFHHADRAPIVNISGQVEDGQCHLVVRDNGIGFDTQYLDRIFKPFQRLHNRDEYEGTGMGLAICRRIVERHHGSITANSNPGEGSTFFITLPIHQPEGETT